VFLRKPKINLAHAVCRMIPISMNPADIAKDAIRIVSTAGLSKDVIDLLKEKVALLTDKISTLEQEKSVLNGENANLKPQIVDLQQQLDRLHPRQDGLDETEIKFLKLLAQQPGLRIEQIASALDISRVKAEYHRDNLRNAKMIGYLGGVIQMGSEPYKLLTAGRSYLAKAGLI
jgi:FtsZ-binding cell division protein ZapB